MGKTSADSSPLVKRLTSAFSRNSVLRVAIVFVLVLAVLLSISMLSADWSGWTPITGAIAAVAGGAARALGLHAVVVGNVIELPNRSLSVDPQCTACDLLAVFSALVLAYPLGWKTKVAGLLAGFAVIEFMNIVRLVGVAFAAQWLSGNSFDLVHDYLFEFGMVFVVIMVWAVWLTRARAHSS